MISIIKNSDVSIVYCDYTCIDEEDNIIENGKAKVDLYIALLKKFGGKCEDV